MQPSDRNNADNLLSKHSPQKVNKPCMPKSNNQSKEHHQRETTTSYKKSIVKVLSIKNNLHWLNGVESKRLFHSTSARQTIKQKDHLSGRAWGNQLTQQLFSWHRGPL